MCIYVGCSKGNAFISMETTIGTKCTLTLIGRANPQLQNTVFQHSHHDELCISAAVNKNLHAVVVKKSVPAAVTHCFPAADGAIAGKMVSA